MTKNLNKFIHSPLFLLLKKFFNQRESHFSTFMKEKQKIYSVFQLASAIFMILALVWLTISIPFVYAGQQLLKKDRMENMASPLAVTEENTANPFGNNTEEKTPPNSTISEEYLHDNHKDDYFFSSASLSYQCENAGTYIAFHGELLVPPPNAA